MLEIRNQTVLVIVAHPDDEILGQGATLHRWIAEFGCRVHVVILGQGITARGASANKSEWEDALSAHLANVERVRVRMGFEQVSLHDFPDNRFDSVPLLDVVKVVEAEKQRVGASILLTHHGGDTNVDHRVTYNAVITATRPMAHEIVKHILCFETFSSTEWQAPNYPMPFQPNFFVAVREEDVRAKAEAMELYESEARPFPHPRSPESLRIQAQRWGTVVGTDYAEAFMLIRSLHLK